MPFYRYSFFAIGVDGMLTAFPQEIKLVLFKVAYKIAPLDRHLSLDEDLFSNVPRLGDRLFHLFVSQNHFI